MKRIHILFCLLALLATGATAQTLEQAKAYYNKGEYAKAKPVFKRFVKSQPANGNYNLWYGVCCLKTGEPGVALKYMQTAVKKRITSGQLYLAQTYDALYRYDEAIETYEEYISELEKRKRSTEEAERLLEKSRANLRLLKGVEQVCVIDSFVVNKKEFLAAYKISPESGALYTYSQYFDVPTEADNTVYETEMANKIYYGEQQKDGKFAILSRTKLMNDWSNGTPLPENINGGQNAGYPYVTTDGVTLYYAADGAESMGGYDIFVTRYNSVNDSYLTPENIGMPFNSPANDYLYVIDEFNNLGWFASDRHQPEDKVCVYVFIPNASKQVYNYEGIEQKQLIRLAQLTSIKETQTDKAAVEEARERLKHALAERQETAKGCDFCFIIDDATTYHKLSDFRSPRAKALFEKYQQTEKALKQQSQKLQSQRAWYARAQEKDRNKMNESIMDLEKQVFRLTDELEQTAIEIRQAEKQ